ncbi:hypothetical protein [Streptomyces sp. NPDC054783]
MSVRPAINRAGAARPCVSVSAVGKRWASIFGKPGITASEETHRRVPAVLSCPNR